MNNTEIINQFLNGHDEMKHIISIECGFNDDTVSIIYRNDKNEKRVKLDDFRPFIWAKNSAAIRLFEGDRKTIKNKLKEFGIGVKALKTSFNNEKSSERLENGYKYIFYAKKKMSYQRFQQFFIQAKTPLYDNQNKTSNREFLAVSPVEQYMISTGRRLFKGYDNYDDLIRLQFDLETQGLNPEIHSINQIGIRTNKGFEKIITIEGNTIEERRQNELIAIIDFLNILADIKPDIIAGHNSENFDWNFIIVRCKILGTSLEELSSKFFSHPIHKKNKESILKLGGEIEYYKPTVMWGYNIVDSLHAVRRAQAIDSSMKSANLKYVTKYLDLKKDNRVYVPGNQIDSIWLISDPNFAFNNENGDWYRISENNPLKPSYEAVSGRYIVERYLLDDIWETDKVELKLNESNFLIGKMLPTTFQRACTMGTAGIWKLILLAWCYEQDLAVSSFSNPKRFTGGLSRLLKVGYADRVVKLDYNSLYPSIILTWKIASKLDISDSMLMMLEYVLSQREKYKELKKSAGKKAKQIKEQLENFTGTKEEKKKLKDEYAYWKAEESANDKKQLPLKILGNSFFGSFGAPDVFPMGDVTCAEKTTCIGRMSLRLMIKHFTNLGYTPIVGDSFTKDTPLIIKYNDTNLIDFKTIEEMIDEKSISIDGLSREYDYSNKNYQVLCRSGWCDVKYVYRHKTNKPIYQIQENNMLVELTEDHSLFNDKQEKIKPSEINENTVLEYYKNEIKTNEINVNENIIKISAKLLANAQIDRIPINIINSNKNNIQLFLDELNKYEKKYNTTKLILAELNFLINKIKK